MKIAAVTIRNEAFWTERDMIRLSDDRYLMVYRVSVQSEGRQEEHWVVTAFTFAVSPAECQSISRNWRKAGSEAIISFQIGDQPGWADVVAILDREFEMFNLAAAIGVIKACCGWDESPSMVVKINGDDVRVRPRFDGKNWVVTNAAE